MTEAPGGPMLLLLTVAFAEDAWLTSDADLVRWPDGEAIVVKSLVEGAKVEIVTEDEVLVRVRSGIDFGWIPASMLTEEEPENALLPPGGLLDGLNLGGGILPGGTFGTPPSFPTPPSTGEE